MDKDKGEGIKAEGVLYKIPECERIFLRFCRKDKWPLQEIYRERTACGQTRNAV